MQTMLRDCPVACGLCKPKPVDRHQDCAAWASDGRCAPASVLTLSSDSPTGFLPPPRWSLQVRTGGQLYAETLPARVWADAAEGQGRRRLARWRRVSARGARRGGLLPRLGRGGVCELGVARPGA